VCRLVGPGPDPGDNCVTFAALEAASVEASIDRTIDRYAALGHTFEWKVYGHDRRDPAPALLARGFAPADAETLVVLDLDSTAAPPVRPLPGVVIERLADDAPLGGVLAVKDAVWGGDHSWLIGALARERAHDPSSLSIWQAVADGRPVANAWVRFVRGSRFASFWGGATLPAWRGRGIYTQLVAQRAAEARGRGARFIYVEASDDSRPILERLGFIALAAVRGYEWRPAR
jgi:GNAT superfamily N-acetyltransferase